MSLRQPPPPKPPGLVPTVIETPEGPKNALVVEGTEPLPPEGEARREILAERKDDLAARIAQLETEMGIDSSGARLPFPTEAEIDRDIARVYDHTSVINPQPGFAYYWANEKAAHGIDVTVHKALRVKGHPGSWVVVCGDMPENPDDRDVRNYRVIGDVILMRIPLATYEAWQEQQRLLGNHRRDSVDSQLVEMGDRMRGRINVSELNEFQLGRLAKRALARETAGAITQSRIRSGRVPGLTPGR